MMSSSNDPDAVDEAVEADEVVGVGGFTLTTIGVDDFLACLGFPPPLLAATRRRAEVFGDNPAAGVAAAPAAAVAVADTAAAAAAAGEAATPTS